MLLVTGIIPPVYKCHKEMLSLYTGLYLEGFGNSFDCELVFY